MSRLLFETTPPPPRVHALVSGWEGELITLGIRVGFYDASGRLLGLAEQHFPAGTGAAVTGPFSVTADLAATTELAGTSFALVTVFDFVTE